jgi:hypothetical protein
MREFLVVGRQAVGTEMPQGGNPCGIGQGIGHGN